MGIRCGIDLGTTHSAIAWYDPDHHRAEAISLDHADGLDTILSAVYLDADHNARVGETAYRAGMQHPEHIIVGVKSSFGMDLITTPSGTSYVPQVIAAEILKVLKVDAERYLGSLITDAVISAPNYFNQQQRQAIKKAGELAGLKVLELFPDPCAAALALAIEQRLPADVTHLLICDLGGGTFDTALVKLERVSADTGGTDLQVALLDEVGESRPIGGLVWDAALARLAMQKARESLGLAQTETLMPADIELLWNCETARQLLNRVDICSIPVMSPEGRVDVVLSHAEFESGLADLISETETLLTRATSQAEQCYGLLTEKRIEELVQSGQSRDELEKLKVYLLLCGGLTGMRTLKECAEHVIGEPPLLPQKPNLLISRGAACRAHQLGTEARPPTGKKKRSGKETGTEQKSRTTSDQPSVVRIIDMFQSLGLPLTDDGPQIEEAAAQRRRRYLKDLNNPDPGARFEATTWFKNIERLLTERATLLGSVRDLFFQMADAIIVSDWRGQKLTTNRYNQLLSLAQEQYRCDEALAKSFVDDYLDLRDFEVGDTLEYQRPLSFHANRRLL